MDEALYLVRNEAGMWWDHFNYGWTTTTGWWNAFSTREEAQDVSDENPGSEVVPFTAEE